MITPSSNDQTIDNPQEYEGPVQALLRLTETAGLLRSTDGSFHARVAVGGRPEVVAFERNREKRLITLTKTNRPEKMPPRLYNNLIGRCFADTFDEQPFDPSQAGEPIPVELPHPLPRPDTALRDPVSTLPDNQSVEQQLTETVMAT